MIKKIFTTVFILSLIVSPKLSFAEALMSTLSLTSTSVTLRAENLTPNTSVTMGVVNKHSADIHYSQYFQTVTNNIGKAMIDFSGLAPGVEYTGSVYYQGSNQVVGSIDFTTIAGMTVTRKDLTQTSVTFLCTGFPANKEISFNVQNYDTNTPTYTDPQDAMTDESGIVIFQFAGLNPGGHYRYTHSETTNFGSFYTLEGDPSTNPPPDPNPSGTGPTGGLVPCTDNCGFADLFTLIQNVINFILFVMALPIAAIMFAYAGFILVTSGGASEKRSKAKSIFLNVAIGLVIVAAAWLIVHTILTIVGYDQSLNWFGL